MHCLLLTDYRQLDVKQLLAIDRASFETAILLKPFQLREFKYRHANLLEVHCSTSK